MVRQLGYSQHTENCIDLVLFLKEMLLNHLGLREALRERAEQGAIAASGPESSVVQARGSKLTVSS